MHVKIRHYLIEMGLGLAAYCATLGISIWVLAAAPQDADYRPLISLLPVLPAAGICWAVIRQVRRSDEMQRLVQFEALAIAFAATALMSLTYGFLENVGFPKISMLAVWPVMAGFWIAGGIIARRRYR